MYKLSACVVILFLFLNVMLVDAGELDPNGVGETKITGGTITQPVTGPTPPTGVVLPTAPEAVNTGNITVAPTAINNAGLVPCDNSPAHPCDFKAFMDLINNVIKFILFDLAVPIAAISFAYAGFKMVTSGGSTEARGTAKNVATNTIYGLVFVATAWLIVRTVLSVLGYDGAWIGF